METFRLLVDIDAVDFLERLPAATRKTLASRLHEIRGAPARLSDYTERDSVGRPVEINICGAFAIKYWIDHADRQVKVLEIHQADWRSHG